MTGPDPITISLTREDAENVKEWAMTLLPMLTERIRWNPLAPLALDRLVAVTSLVAQLDRELSRA